MDRERSFATADALTRAMEHGDARSLASLYVPEAVVWHSTDQTEMNVGAVVALVQAIASVAKCSIDVRARLKTEDGFVQTQKNNYVFRDGGRAEFHAALVVTLDGSGRIVRLEEYLDSAGLAPLIRALG